ncbi:unnamed protein product [Urochloa humidicola]
MGKREKNDLLLRPSKRIKVKPPGSMVGKNNGCLVERKDGPCIVASRTDNLTSRENKLFDSIVGLITKGKEDRVCASSSNLLSEEGSVLMMEFNKDEEVLLLWLKSFTGPRVRFLVHPVCTIEAAAAAAKHPLISFSDNFVDSEGSRLVKSVLTEIFEGGAYGDDPDYLFAFSRQGNFVHLRTYQVLEVPDHSSSKKKFKLSNLVQHFCFATSLTVAGSDDVKTSKDFELLEDSVFIGDQSVGILHSALLKGSFVRFVLEDLPDLSSWDGFTSCLSDFKERNTPMFTGRLLGDAPGQMTSYPNERYKTVIRSLLIDSLGLHGKELCFHKISDSDVCLRGTTVKLSWKLELIEYDILIARSNRREIRTLILNMFKGQPLPRDLQVLLELLNCEYLVPVDYLLTHCSLMYDANKSHMIDDIYTEFSSNLTTRHKLLVAEPLSFYINNWKELIKPNELLLGISTHKFGLKKDPDAALASVSVEVAPEEGQINKDDSEAAPEGSQKNKDDSEAAPEESQKNKEDSEAEPEESQKNKNGVEVDGGNSIFEKVRGVGKLIGFIRHSNVHLFDEVKTQFKKQSIKIQQRETVRIITSRLPILHILQNEMRNILGDKWFVKYFSRG